MQAECPICLSWLDYKKRLGGPGILFYPTGDYEKDLKEIQAFYKDKVAKHPNNFNLSEQYRKNETNTAI
jgi:hypothetical protein